VPTAGSVDARLYVPARAVVRRAELTAVYVLGADGRAVLRQVRLGRSEGDRVEVLAGVSAGERVVLDPQAAARQY
jgi:multidrug efflux pump subunit AcrA (membrane-fusion protein)